MPATDAIGVRLAAFEAYVANNDDDANEAMQTALIQIWKFAGNYNGGSRAFTWKRIGPHCMKMIGCCPSRRIGVAVRPNTNFAFARLRMPSNETAPT